MLQSLDQALESFSRLVAADIQSLTAMLDAYLIDGLQNGKAQKFEYTLEICWKTVKVFLQHCEGIDEASPKKIIKAFYLNEYQYVDLRTVVLALVPGCHGVVAVPSIHCRLLGEEELVAAMPLFRLQ